MPNHFTSRQGNVVLWLVLFYPGFAVAAHAFPNSEPTNALYDRSETTLILSDVISWSHASRSAVHPCEYSQESVTM